MIYVLRVESDKVAATGNQPHPTFGLREHLSVIFVTTIFYYQPVALAVNSVKAPVAMSYPQI